MFKIKLIRQKRTLNCLKTIAKMTIFEVHREMRQVDVRNFEFSDMQLDRFAYLVGTRLKGNKFKLVVK